MRNIFWFLLVLVGLVALFVVSINWWIVSSTDDLAFSNTEELPGKDVALVLGTASSPDGRQVNDFFYHRVQAAYELYRDGKVRHFILSGDNHREQYNEPRDMQDLLVKFGVPPSKITLDYAGFRTLDSVVRSKKVFGQESICIVSQAFHTPRALFIARRYDMDAVAYNAQINDENAKYRQVLFREYLARVKAFLDLYILDTQPRFLGEKEKIKF
ncbi:MAG TPA: ElyC/SanA/YdcF family protein [Saprospiraceae bacterium]|nr:ElyC/SanA/YdcF family protein [Saprospiraceae bacterium]